MKELTSALNRMSVDREEGPLLQAAQKWASFAVGTFTDDLLWQALQISTAIANFTAELAKHK